MGPPIEQSIVIVGAGGHALACIDLVREEGCYEIVGLFGRREELGKSLDGANVVGTDEDLSVLGKRIASAALVAVGQIHTPDSRIRIFNMLQAQDFALPSIVSPRAYLSRSAKLGRSTLLLHGAIVNAGAEIGVNCIINSRALIEHGVLIGDHCHISTAAVVNGDAVVGDGSFVGSGAVIREGVTIGRRCVIGMGALVQHNLPDGAVFYGKSIV
jgi:sugar O-acyltransferase (sialic acid O-acetyltransferase NeuD family)